MSLRNATLARPVSASAIAVGSSSWGARPMQSQGCLLVAAPEGE
jgi:hypothetical protein